MKKNSTLHFNPDIPVDVPPDSLVPELDFLRSCPSSALQKDQHETASIAVWGGGLTLFPEVSNFPPEEPAIPDGGAGGRPGVG